MKKNLIVILILLSSVFFNGIGEIIQIIVDVKNPWQLGLFRDKVVVRHYPTDPSFTVYDGKKWIHYSPEDIKRIVDDSVYLSKFGFLRPCGFNLIPKGIFGLVQQKQFASLMVKRLRHIIHFLIAIKQIRFD